MSIRTDIPWSLMAEASVIYIREQATELDLAHGVQITYRPPGGLTQKDYDFFEIEGYEDELIPAPSALPPAPPNTLPSFTWFHAQTEQPPAEFRYGPLAGTQRDFAAQICPGKRIDTRRLQRKAAIVRGLVPA